VDASDRRSKTEPTLVLCGYSLLPVDKRACDLLLNEPGKETHITVISGGEFAFGIAQSATARPTKRWLHLMLDRCTVLDSALQLTGRQHAVAGSAERDSLSLPASAGRSKGAPWSEAFLS